ncbi:MAG: tRNA-(ms[2]io[6]A)-hydroxylase [Archangium sp.]|nr:tRNA-(ms[2]io[6]A)-hydroxylase [Archangium sp.]MDP3155860.1 tRNA-(ms[2]io[6]A)-hydroxylase [Archangium sp.]MDP3575430.1 tRNA-(ms[2]io[6]A)-hydroxylase [Archangium sp.]
MTSQSPSLLRGEGSDITLQRATDPQWLVLALSHFDEVLIDHAHCEKKAASNALSLMQAYPEVPGLPSQMARLAREESAHLAKVLQIMEDRGLLLGRDGGDPYAQGLQKLMRNGMKERQLDRFLVAGIIEARSAERLSLLAEGLTDDSLKRFYTELATSEDGHQRLFLRLAQEIASQDVVHARLAELLEGEAKLIAVLPLRPAIH